MGLQFSMMGRTIDLYSGEITDLERLVKHLFIIPSHWFAFLQMEQLMCLDGFRSEETVMPKWPNMWLQCRSISAKVFIKELYCRWSLFSSTMLYINIAG